MISHGHGGDLDTDGTFVTQLISRQHAYEKGVWVTKRPSGTPLWLRKLREWAARYLPAEIVGTASAILCAIVAFEITGERAVAAVAGAVAENLGFYSIIAITEWGRQKSTGRSGVLPRAARTSRVMLAEFGPAEALDSLLLRPFTMYVGPIMTGEIGTGTLLGKLLADAIFYGLAIISYEIAQHRARLAGGSLKKVVRDFSDGRSSDTPRLNVLIYLRHDQNKFGKLRSSIKHKIGFPPRHDSALN